MSVRASLIGSIAPVAPGEVLVVDADEKSRKDAARHLSNLAIRAREAESGERALALAEQYADTLDCILLDLKLPDIDAFEIMKRLRAAEETSAIPVMVVLDKNPSDADLVKIIESGAVDHVAKPHNGILLCAKVRAVCDRAKTQREMKSKLRFALENAAHDPLTGMFNRRYFERRLREESAHARRHKRPFAIVMLDLDHFKLINDTYGHEDGDVVLRHLAEVTIDSLREDDIACRYGGEEFVLLLRQSTGMAARIVANRLRQSLASKPVTIGDKHEPRHITFSAGVAAADDRNNFKADDIVARADAALYRAKRGGRNRVELE